MVIALYALASYLLIASLIAVLARLAGLPWGIAVLAGVSWLPELIGILIEARKK